MNEYLQGGDPMYNFPNDTQMTVEKTLKANTSHPDTHFQRCIRRARRKAFAASEDVEDAGRRPARPIREDFH